MAEPRRSWWSRRWGDPSTREARRRYRRSLAPRSRAIRAGTGVGVVAVGALAVAVTGADPVGGVRSLYTDVRGRDRPLAVVEALDPAAPDTAAAAIDGTVAPWVTPWPGPVTGDCGAAGGAATVQLRLAEPRSVHAVELHGVVADDGPVLSPVTVDVSNDAGRCERVSLGDLSQPQEAVVRLGTSSVVRLSIVDARGEPAPDGAPAPVALAEVRLLTRS